MITYRPEFGLYWPDYDTLAERTHAAIVKRKHHALAVLPYVRGRSCVVQAGGHVGVWPMELAKKFGTVHTFEPDEACFRALYANACGGGDIPPLRRIFARCAALSIVTGIGVMEKGKCSSWRFHPACTETPPGAELATAPVASMTIDSLSLGVCDAIILDVEGSELDALRGATQTIARCRPVIQLEEWYDNRADYLDFMHGLGYRPVTCAGADTIYVPNLTT